MSRKRIWVVILSVLIGMFVCFAIVYWLFDSSLKMAWISSLSVLFGALVMELLEAWGKNINRKIYSKQMTNNSYNKSDVGL